MPIIIYNFRKIDLMGLPPMARGANTLSPFPSHIWYFFIYLLGLGLGFALLEIMPNLNRCASPNTFALQLSLLNFDGALNSAANSRMSFQHYRRLTTGRE